MADAIESYVIQIGIDQKATLDALKKLQASLGGVTKTAQGGEKQIASLQDKAKGLGQSIEGLLLPLASIFGMGKIWNTFAEGGRQLQHFSEISDISASKLDKWAQANEAAGGSYEAFVSGIVALKQKYRMSDEQIFGIGKAIQGMDRLTKIQYLRQFGLSPEASMIFLKQGANAENYANRFAGTARSASEIKAASEASLQWRRVTRSAERLGNTMAMTVLPIVQKVFDWLNRTARSIEKNEIAVKALIALIAMPTAVKGIKMAVSVATSLKNVFISIKGILPSVIALGGRLGKVFLALKNAVPLILSVVTKLNPVTALISTAIALIVAGIAYLMNKFGGLDSIIANLSKRWSEFKSAIPDISFDAIAVAFNKTLEAIKSGISEAFASIGDLFTGKWEKFLDSLSFIGDLFKSAFTFGGGEGANTGLASSVVTNSADNRNQSNQVSVQTTNNITVNGNADPKAVAQATQKGTDRSLQRATLSTLTATR